MPGPTSAASRSRYATAAGDGPAREPSFYAAGTKKEKGADVRVDAGAPESSAAWEELNRYGKDGFMGCAVVVDPARLDSTPETRRQRAPRLPRAPAPHYAGTGWDRSGDFKSLADFDAHVDRVRGPLGCPGLRAGQSALASDPVAASAPGHVDVNFLRIEPRP
jgi:hypothetical protein